MTLHPFEVRAGNPYGYFNAVEQHQQPAALRDSWGNPGIPKDSEEKTGYADVESKERFPHPHSLDDGGEMRENPLSNSYSGSLSPLLNQK
jgi:hypothetical protein